MQTISKAKLVANFPWWLSGEFLYLRPMYIFQDRVKVLIFKDNSLVYLVNSDCDFE